MRALIHTFFNTIAYTSYSIVNYEKPGRPKPTLRAPDLEPIPASPNSNLPIASSLKRRSGAGGGTQATDEAKNADKNGNHESESKDDVGSVGKKHISAKSSLEDFLSVGSLQEESITP